MASSALEEKINKIRLQNEEIRRRYEEVEADKKNAAKLNALVQMVPSDDWPERKEPPEFSTPPKNTPKQKFSNKEYTDRPVQHYSGIQERLGKKDHKFAQGDGPPPDPKYNFLADSEREMRTTDDSRTDEDKNRSRNRPSRGAPRRRGGAVGVGGGGGSRDAYFKDNRGPHAFHSKEESLPEYEAWRAERNRIDEARINRQKTAEGNWRREWDINKTNVEKDVSRKGESNRKDSSNFERRNNHYDSDYSNRGHGGSRTYHGSQKNQGHQDFRRSHQDQSHEYKKQDIKPPLSPTDDRTVSANDKGLKVTVNHGNQIKGQVMSVKVNSPNIAGTGRVGPRQKSRVTYSSQSDAETSNQEVNNFSRQKSFDEKAAGVNFNNGQKSSKSPFPQRKKDVTPKSPYTQRKEYRNDETSSTRPKNQTKGSHPQKNDTRDQRQSNNYASKTQRVQKSIQKPIVNDVEDDFTSDDAIPTEYNPDKSSDRGNLMEQKNVNESEKVQDATILAMNDNVETNQHVNSQSTEIDEINKDTEQVNIDESVKMVELDTNIKPDISDKNLESVETDKHTECNPIDQNIEKEENLEEKDFKEINRNDLKNDNIHTDNAENINSENIDAENIHIDNTKIENNTDTIIAENIHTDNIDIDNNYAEDIHADNIKAEDINTNNITAENINIDNNYAENIHTNNIKAENINTDNITTENINVDSVNADNINVESTNESIEKDESHVEILKQVLHNLEDSKSSETLLLTSDKIDETLKHNLCTNTQTQPNISDNELESIPLPEKVEEIEISVSKKNDEDAVIELEEKDKCLKNSEVVKEDVSNKNNQILIPEKSEVSKSMDNEKIELLHESDIINKSMELNETIESDNSQNKSSNDSGFVDDSLSETSQNTSNIIESSTENNTKECITKVSAESDLIDLTKGECEKVEICDISAAPSEILQRVEDRINECEVKQEINVTEENSTKDNVFNIVKDKIGNSELSKLIDLKNENNDLPGTENSIKELSTNVATEESKEQ